MFSIWCMCVVCMLCWVWIVCFLLFLLIENQLFIVQNSILQPLCLVLDFEWIISVFFLHFLSVNRTHQTFCSFEFETKTSAENVSIEKLIQMRNIESKFALICKIIINHIHIRSCRLFFAASFGTSKSNSMSIPA